MAGTGVLAIALAGAPFAVWAEEPAGSITLSRDIPARNAFRAGAPGPEHRVATAREDVVIASTGALAGIVGSLPNPAGQDRIFHGNGALPTQGPSSVAGAVLDAGVVRLPAATTAGAMEGLTGGAIASPMGSMASTLSTMMRGR